VTIPKTVAENSPKFAFSPPTVISRSQFGRNIKSIARDAKSKATNLDDLRQRSLLLAALKKGLTFAKEKAHHVSEDTTDRNYVGNTPVFQLSVLSKMAKFQRAFQISIVPDIEKFAEMVGLPEKSLQDSIKKMQNTGLGIYCKDPKYGSQLGFPKGTTCGAFDKCIGCEQFNPVVLADKDNVARLIAFNEHLKKSQNKMMIINEVKWNEDWLPWVAFTEAALEKLTGRQFMILMKEANSLVKSENYVFPELW
jgi:hypothetical protein